MGFFSFFKKDKEKSKKYKMGLHKTREGALKNIKQIVEANNKIDDNLFDALEEVFISAEIGVDTVIDFISSLKEEVNHKKITDVKILEELIIDKMFDLYTNNEIVNANLKLNKEGLSVILFVGVNGVGKTTSIGKMAARLARDGKKVVVAAADTFRAAAVEQLEVWAKRAGAEIVKRQEGSDPASVVYEAIDIKKKENADVLIIDTAGRLHNKKYLMDELNKIQKVVNKEMPESSKEVLLVIDATTGQNAISQVKAFKEQADITGIVLTKLDGTAKGGVVVGIVQENNIPVKFIGVGEQIDDMEIFNAKDFAKAII